MRTVIADDTALLRHGLARLLGEAGIDVCGEAADGQALLQLVERERPDVAIVDIRMPPSNSDEGLVAATAIRTRFPAVGVLVLSQYVELAYAMRLFSDQQGGCGYLLKDRVTNTDELVDALKRVAAGELVIDRALVDLLMTQRRDPDPLRELTDREREVLALMAEGFTDRAIAERLWITTNTVETHVRHILHKLALPCDDARNRRVQAVLIHLDG